MNYNMPDRDKRQKTDRGWVIYDEFEDRYESAIRVHESSIAFEPCVWIFANDADGARRSPHLTPEQAKRLIAALQQFVDDSEHEENVAASGIDDDFDDDV